MNTMNENSLARIAGTGLEKCLRKMNSVSPGEWRLENLRAFSGMLPDAAGCLPAGGAHAVRVTVHSVPPFDTLLLFGAEDLEHIYRCFVSDRLSAAIPGNRHEVTLIELGNIILNALVNALLKSMNKSAIPSVPEYFKADPSAIATRLGSRNAGTLTIVSATLAIERGGRTASAEVLALLPEALTAEL
jgi:hypothetical protein